MQGHKESMNDICRRSLHLVGKTAVKRQVSQNYQSTIAIAQELAGVHGSCKGLWAKLCAFVSSAVLADGQVAALG